MNNKRIAAGFIDFMTAASIQSFLGFTFILKPSISNNGSIESVFPVMLMLSYISITYMVIRDILGKKSPGKRILKLNVIDHENKTDATFLKRFLRNLTWYLGPIEVLSFLITGKRIGDKICKTDVVEIH